MSDLWLPNVTRKPIAPGANDPSIVPVMLVFHRSASRGASLYEWFAHGSGGIESHGYTTRDGHSEQYRAFNYEADAQAAGNSWLVNGVRLGAISWETEGTGEDNWTPEQIAEITRIIAFCEDVHGIPWDIVSSANPVSLAEGGVGWHSKYQSWNPGVHNCPGSVNVAALQHLLKNPPAVTSFTRPTTPRPVLRKSKPHAHPHWTRYLQRHLNHANQKEHIHVTGVYDDATVARVKQYRRRHKIWPYTGTCGARVWNALGVPRTSP